MNTQEAGRHSDIILSCIERNNITFKEVLDKYRMFGTTYYSMIIPKIHFGRQQGHTTAVIKFIQKNPNLDIIIISNRPIGYMDDLYNGSRVQGYNINSICRNSYVNKRMGYIVPNPATLDYIIFDESYHTKKIEDSIDELANKFEFNTSAIKEPKKDPRIIILGE